MKSTENQKRLSALWYRKNRAKQLAKAKAWVVANPRARKAALLKHYYGMTLAEFDAILLAQNNRCAICFNALLPGRGTVVDHDHATGAVRGILCDNCNKMLGHAKDDHIRLYNGAVYLTRHKCASS